MSYNSSFYHGPALKAGAGVTGGQASQFAAAHGYRVVTGDSPTVGVAGGFTQGGGHSQLSGVYGLGADNVLEWEVVTAEGIHLVATPTKNSDLYWALSGGGGGTYEKQVRSSWAFLCLDSSRERGLDRGRKRETM